MRKIKQLGLAYFVYCGSDYSRFYHTTGVVFLADRMAVSINKCNVNTREQQEYFKSVVRLAAVFHDVGHMFLSHVSEHYFGKSPLYPRYQMINNMLETFEKKARKNVSLHELLSCMIVNTNEVRRLLRLVSKRLPGICIDQEKDLEQLIEYISGLITGVPVDRAVLPYSSVINGPIDADKCDYLSRDSHVTRVPVAVDISRLTQKLNVVEASEINTSDLWHMDSETSRPYYELAMSDSAEKALFQLCIARTIMFDSVYYHHKVLTAETELRELINILANMEEPIFNSFTEILEYTDDDFNKYFFEQLKTTRKQEDTNKINGVRQDWEHLYTREMAKRIACIMPEFLQGSQESRERLFDEVLTLLNSPGEKSLLDNVQQQYDEICKLLAMGEAQNRLIRLFVIQPPNILYGHSKIQVPINLDNGKKREFRGYELVSSRETSSSSSYIVAETEHKELAYLALEKVLRMEYSILLKDECGACGKYDQDKMRRYRLILFEKGYYDESPELIRDEFLANYISNDKIKNLVKQFKTYDGPGGHYLDEDEIKRFFKQILCTCKRNESSTVIPGIYRLLKEADFVDRTFIVKGMTDALQKIETNGRKVNIIPLGARGDSAVHMMYYFNDIKKEYAKINFNQTLVEVLQEKEESVIVFFDDGSYSGRQLLSIMQEYAGIPKTERATSEHHVDPLDPELFHKLSTSKIVFCFLMFNSNNLKEQEEDLRNLGLTDFEFLYFKDMNRKLLEVPSVLTDETERNIVKTYLQQVGMELVHSQKMEGGKYKVNWDEKRVREAALGYNDAQQMVFLKSSVPTYTITPFWFEGMYRGIPWKPLFRRTSK